MMNDDDTIPEETIEEDEDKSTIFEEYQKIVEQEREDEERQRVEDEERAKALDEAEIGVDYFEDQATETHIDETSGKSSGPKFDFSRLKFRFREIPLPLIHPGFMKMARESGDVVPIFLNCVEYYSTLIQYPLNFIFFTYYMIILWSFQGPVNPGFYPYVEWGMSMLWIPIMFIIGTLRYFVCLNALISYTEKTKRILWIVHLFSSFCYLIFLVWAAVGGGSTLGLVKAVIITDVFPYFWAILTFAVCLAAMIGWILLFMLTFVMFIFGIVELVVLKKKLKTRQENEPNLADVVQGDGGNVVFFNNMAFVFK